MLMPRATLLRYALLAFALVTFAACGGSAEDGAAAEGEETASEQTEAGSSASGTSSTFAVPSDFPVPSGAEKTDESTASAAYYTVSDMSAEELVDYFETQIPSSDYTATRGQAEAVETANYTRLASWTVMKGEEDYTLQVRSYSDGTVGFTVAD